MVVNGSLAGPEIHFELRYLLFRYKWVIFNQLLLYVKAVI